jgi:hypothetical protein
MSVIAWIVIGLLAGWLATRIMGGRGGLMRKHDRHLDRDGQATTKNLSDSRGSGLPSGLFDATVATNTGTRRQALFLPRLYPRGGWAK